jgi:hypothetical protein
VDIINQYNKFASNGNNLIKKALSSATGAGEALIPQKLEKVITNTLTYLMPEMAIIEPEFDNQKLHEFNRLNALPKAGGAMGEGAVTPTRSAQYVRDSVTMKVVRRKGAVTNFLKDSSQKYIDAAAIEMENHLYSHALDLAFYMYYGNELANPYEYGGLDRFINTSFNRMNNTVGGVVPTSLKFLDDLIDKNTRKQGAPHKKAFVMSPEMLSKVSSLLTNVRLNQGLSGGGLTEIEINGGWRMNAYRNIPIIESTFTRPQDTMGVVTPSTTTTGGTIAAATYFFRVSKVTYFGEQNASAQISQVTTGTTSSITFSCTAEADALQYRIYAGNVSGALTLKRIVSAFTYDGVGSITGDRTSIVFTSNPLVAGTEVVGEMTNDVPLVPTGGVPSESIFLWDLDKYQGLGKFAYTNTGGSKFNGLVTVEELAKTDDNLPFLIKTYGAMVPSFQSTSMHVRGLRVE